MVRLYLLEMSETLTVEDSSSWLTGKDLDNSKLVDTSEHVKIDGRKLGGSQLWTKNYGKLDILRARVVVFSKDQLDYTVDCLVSAIMYTYVPLYLYAHIHTHTRVYVYIHNICIQIIQRRKCQR